MRRALTSSVASCLLVGLAAGCAMQAGDEATGHVGEEVTVCAAGTTVKGLDVSSYQGSITWASVKAAGNDFAIARISDGSALDSDFATNWAGMKAAGLIRGAYQYFEPGQDPTTQANIVISAVGKLGNGDLPVTADMEATGGQSAATIVAHLQTWVAAVEAGTGKTPMVYTASGYWNSSVGGSTAFGSLPLWVANWGVTCPSMPTGWSNWAFWQTSDTGSVSGISGAVDLDEFNGSLAQLQSFAGGGTTTGDGGTPGIYAATYVSQSWPLATTTMMMNACDVVHANIVFKNTGTTTWDSNTRLATTQPRDRMSVFADGNWLAGNRLAAVTGTVPPGSTYQFDFDFHAPATAGMYDEFFGLVEEGVAWFSDPGQGGPPDNDIEAKIQVVATDGGPCAPVGSHDAGVSPGDAGATTGDAGTSSGGGDAGAVGPDGGGSSGSSSGGTGSGSGGGSGGNNAAAPTSGSNGCGCVAAGTETSSLAPGALALAVAFAARRRRRRS